MEQQASVCCLLVMRVTLGSGLGPAWNVDQDDLTVGRTALCVVLYPQSPIPANPLSRLHFWVFASCLRSHAPPLLKVQNNLTNVRMDGIYSSVSSMTVTAE